MRSSALLVLAALAGSGFCQSYTTFKGFLDTLPSCSRSCATEAYQSFVDGCGGEKASLDCVCKSEGGADSEARADAKAGWECVTQKCNDNDSLSFANGILHFTSFCIEKVTGTPSPSNSPSNSASNSASNSDSPSNSNHLLAPALALSLLGSGLALAI